jgi:predicted adenine nucleotide alpha hydrolase (AANH) superfamily ATPase
MKDIEALYDPDWHKTHRYRVEDSFYSGAVSSGQGRKTTVSESLELWWQSYCGIIAFRKTHHEDNPTTADDELRAREARFDSKLSRLANILVRYELVIGEEVCFDSQVSVCTF